MIVSACCIGTAWSMAAAVRLRSFKALKNTPLIATSTIAHTATANGIETVGAFFSLALAKELREKHGPAAFITSHNACAHIDQLDDVMKGVAQNPTTLLVAKATMTLTTIAIADTLWRNHHRGQAIAVMVISNGLMAAVAAKNASVLR